MTLSCTKNILGECYIPPAASDYFDIGLFGSLQAHLLQKSDTEAIVFGDLNSRVWNKKDLNSLLTKINGKYRDTPDAALNGNGKRLLQICQDTNSVIINHLDHRNRL